MPGTAAVTCGAAATVAAGSGSAAATRAVTDAETVAADAVGLNPSSDRAGPCPPPAPAAGAPCGDAAATIARFVPGSAAASAAVARRGAPTATTTTAATVRPRRRRRASRAGDGGRDPMATPSSADETRTLSPAAGNPCATANVSGRHPDHEDDGETGPTRSSDAPGVLATPAVVPPGGVARHAGRRPRRADRRRGGDRRVGRGTAHERPRAVPGAGDVRGGARGARAAVGRPASLAAHAARGSGRRPGRRRRAGLRAHQRVGRTREPGAVAAAAHRPRRDAVALGPDGGQERHPGRDRRRRRPGLPLARPRRGHARSARALRRGGRGRGSAGARQRARADAAGRPDGRPPRGVGRLRRRRRPGADRRDGRRGGAPPAAGLGGRDRARRRGGDRGPAARGVMGAGRHPRDRRP